MLRNGLLDGVLHIGTLALDHAERNTVHEEDDIGPIGVGRSRAADGELLRNMKDVVTNVLPVNVLHHKTFAVAIDNLLESLPEGKQIVGRLRSRHETLVHRDIAQRLNSDGDVLLGEHGGPRRANLYDVNSGNPLAKNGFEQHIGDVSAAQRQCFVGCQIGVPQLFQHQQRGNLADMVFFEGKIHCLLRYF